MIKHPFRVGQHYRNRDGEYEVISINEPNMVIRYRDGRTLKSSIELQARIWDHIQEDMAWGKEDFDLTDDSRGGGSRKTAVI